MKLFRSLLVVAGCACGAAVYAADVAANWENHCASCHGADGRGDTKMGKRLKIKDLTSAEVQASFTDAAAMKAVKEGIRDEKTGKLAMKPIEGLSDEEIQVLVAHVRSLKK
ncbi:MAG: cytochrome c [Opitutae bacterium]|nr:cytochrome c [Opitutae bacterium]